MSEVNEVADVAVETIGANEVEAEISPASAVKEEIRGYPNMPDSFDIKGNTVTREEVLQFAFNDSKYSLVDWNRLSVPKRKQVIDTALASLHKQLTRAPKITQPGEKAPLSFEDKKRIKENKFGREVAGQQWAGLAALKDQINYAPDNSQKPKQGKKAYRK